MHISLLPPGCFCKPFPQPGGTACKKDKIKIICVMIFVATTATLLLTTNHIESVQAFSVGPPGGHTGHPRANLRYRGLPQRGTEHRFRGL